MLKHFPQIENFFEKDYFTQDDLLLLEESLPKLYEDPKVVKKARELIKLRLLYFQLTKLVPSAMPVAHVRDKSENQNKKQPKKAGEVKKETASKIPTKPKLLKLNVNQFEGISLKEMAEELKVSCSRFISLYARKGMTVNQDTEMSKKDLLVLVGYIQNRIERVNRDRQIEYSKSLPKRKKYKNNKSTGRGIKAYDAIQTHGLGKLIYIRKK
jgi:hypothetical protein